MVAKPSQYTCLRLCKLVWLFCGWFDHQPSSRMRNRVFLLCAGGGSYSDFYPRGMASWSILMNVMVVKPSQHTCLRICQLVWLFMCWFDHQPSSRTRNCVFLLCAGSCNYSDFYPRGMASWPILLSVTVSKASYYTCLRFCQPMWLLCVYLDLKLPKQTCIPAFKQCFKHAIFQIFFFQVTATSSILSFFLFWKKILIPHTKILLKNDHYAPTVQLGHV